MEHGSSQEKVVTGAQTLERGERGELETDSAGSMDSGDDRRRGGR